jgi:hypothetical protein
MKDEKRRAEADLHFSQSQIGLLAKCPQAFAFRYGEKKKKPPSAAMTFGTVFDRAICHSLDLKVESGEDLPTSDVQEIAVAELELEKDETDWKAEPFAKVKDELAPTVALYHEDHARLIDPASVQKEIKFDFDLDGVEATWVSYLDVEERSGAVRDLKTAARKWPRGREKNEVQPVTYTMHRPGEDRFRFDIAIRSKTKPQVDVREVTVTQAEKDAFGAAFVAIARQALELKKDPEKARPTARFMPGAWWCSQKWCGFWRECQARWNLPIPE